MSGHQTVIITGGSRGIGAETAKLFAQNGFSVCINYKSNDAAAASTLDRISQYGPRCISVKADISVGDEVNRMFDEVERSLGTPSVLVNNAGVLQQQCRLVDMSEARIAEILRTNVMSCFLCCREAVKRMSTRLGGSGGVIVNVSSGAAKSGSPNEYIDYAASKGAIDTLTRGLALEVANEGIRVNAVRPGLIYTDIHAAGGEPDRVNRLSSKIPMQRGGQPSEVAEAIYWLGTDKSSFVTGSFIDASGGL